MTKKENDNQTNNSTQPQHRKSKDGATRTPPKIGGLVSNSKV